MSKFERFFNEIANQLDLTDTEQKTIIQSYTAVGMYLRNSEYLKKYNPNIFPQGSARLGTIVKPLKKDDYDIDLVCELNNATFLNPKDVKQIVGRCLKEGRYATQLEYEHGRCWTLSYSANPAYHLDILAGISIENSRVKATIKRDGTAEYSWLITNPKGFANWFGSLYKKPRLVEDYATVEKVNIYKNKTPLQRAVQLIKRHRDVNFEKDPDIGPASVIITALTGLCYKGETTIEEVLKNGPISWASKIKKEKNKYIIKIPSLPDDNYADKWNGEDPKAAKIFFEWHSKLISDLDILFSQTKNDSFLKKAKEMFKESTVDKVLFENVDIADSLKQSFGDGLRLPMRIEDSHPLFKHALPISSVYKFLPRGNVTLKIYGEVFNGQDDSRKGTNRLSFFENNSELLDKGLSLRFVATPSTKNNMFLKWQITNTGEDALRNGRDSLRGKFENSDSSWVKYEYTSYSGTHFVQAFLIDKNTNTCVAKSNILKVNIRGGDNDEI